MVETRAATTPIQDRIGHGICTMNAGDVAEGGFPVVPVERRLGVGDRGGQRLAADVDVAEHDAGRALGDGGVGEELLTCREVAPVDLFPRRRDEPRLAALGAVPRHQRLGRLAAQLGDLGHQPAKAAGLLGVGGRVGGAVGLEVLLRPVHQRLHQPLDHALPAAVAVNIVPLRQRDCLVERARRRSRTRLVES